MTMPADWNRHELADIAFGGIANGVFKQRSSFGHGTALINVMDTYRSLRVSLSSLERVDVTAEEEKRFSALPGDLFFVRSSLKKEGIGNCCILLDTEEPCVFDCHLMRVRPNQSLVEPLFLAIASTAGRFRADIIASSGTTTMTTLSQQQLGSVKVILPPLSEQRKIADILTTWDKALENLDGLVAAKNRRKQALMQQLLTGKKRLRTYGKKDWKKVRMNQLLERAFRPIQWSAEMSLSLISIRRRCGGLFRRPVLLGSEYKTQDLHDLKAGDFLVSKRQVAHGAWAMVTPEFEGGHVSKEYAIFTNSAPGKLHMPFFAWLAQTPRMIRLSRVASTGVHIEKLIFDPAVFLRESIRLPATLKEQQHIAAILDAADQELILLRKQRNALEQQKRGLMQRLLTGKIRVKP